VTRRTLFLARLIGLFFILLALTLSSHKQESLMAFDAVVHSQDILLVTGIVALAAGLAMVIGHNVWSGGAPVVLVTLIGWIVLVRGVLILLLPADVIGFVYDLVRVDRYFYVIMAIIAAIGIYLTWASVRGAKAAAASGQ
jgi:hypothetical protein